MSNAITKMRATTFVSAVAQWRSRLRPGIAARLAISFIAVAVLAIAASLIVEGRVSVFRTTAARHEPTPSVAPPAAPVLPVTQSVLSPLVRSSFPSAAPLLRTVDRMSRAPDAGADGDIADTSARYQNLAVELEHIAADFGTAATAAGESPPARFLPTVKSYRQRGADLIRLAGSRHSSISGYSAHFEQLNARLKQSPDHAWNLFGRVVARQSLMKLADDLDDLRRRHSELLSADSIDSSLFGALGASEGALAQTLAQDRGGFTRAYGEAWYTKSHDDLEAMSAARKTLLQIDRQRRDDARKFAEDGTTLAQIVVHMGKAGTFGEPRVVAAADSRAGSSRNTTDTPAGTATAAALVASNTTQSAPPAQVQRSVGTNVVDPQDQDGKAIAAWVTGGVLLLVIYISAGTALSIVRPVRRLLSATARLVGGESTVRVPHAGIRELDTLGVAFNDMAAQLAAAREAARDQQNLVEAKVVERTLQLQELAQLDPLTQLANRRHFLALLNTAIESAARDHRLVGVFFLDIDNFKTMNDSLGHAFGDQVLQTIARRLAESTRSFGFAARLGGDEFTVVFESAGSIEDIRAAGLQLVQAFEQPLPLNGRELVVSVSVGASVFPNQAENAELLLRAADAALFEAKALGRGQFALFTPELLEAATAKFTVEQGLRRAIERGEFELVFQPEVNLQTCETELVEALLRWRMPDGRCALPGEFLAIAEDSGLMTQINEWVLRRVIETAARWHHGTWPAARVAINVSSHQLIDDSFVAQVQALLAQFKLPPRCIEIELTENVLQTGSATIDALRRLRAHGIAIALDDFGTGFSSLASLEQLPLTRIKLDRSLMASIDTSARSAAIARAIIGLCQGLGLAITAEGIERPAQLTPLLGYPALYAQGYLLARPVSCDELIPVLNNLPARIRALVRSSVARLPEAQLAEHLPFVTAAIKH